MWPLEHNELASLMLKVGKHRARKDIHKLKQTVQDIKKKYKSLRKASTCTPYSWSQFCRFMCVKSVAHRKLEYSHKLSPTDLQSIEDHMNSDDISFPLPDQKYAGKRFMKTSMKKCLNMYNLAEATKCQISLSTLYRLRPKSVKLKGKIPLRQSCCEKCLNFDNVAKEAFTYLAGTSKDLHEAVDLTLCPYSGTYPKIECIL